MAVGVAWRAVGSVRCRRLEGPFRNFLSVRKIVLEAGCGQGQLVTGLHTRGRDRGGSRAEQNFKLR